jgi:ADP-ribose pyrophosphatase
MPVARWEVLESRYVVDNRPWSRVRRDRCRLPSGEVIDYYTQEYPDWVNAVVLTPDEEIVLVRQYRHGIRDVVVELPGGIVDPGEDPAAAAVREVEEETGYRSGLPPMRLAELYPNPATSNNRVTSYLLREARPATAPRPDSTEELELVVLPFARFLEAVESGRVPHIFSTAAVLLARAHLASRP